MSNNKQYTSKEYKAQLRDVFEGGNTKSFQLHWGGQTPTFKREELSGEVFEGEIVDKPTKSSISAHWHIWIAIIAVMGLSWCLGYSFGWVFHRARG
jgi:hypothetical protein